MKNLLGAFVGLVAMAVLTGALFLMLRGYAVPSQPPAAPPVAVQPLATPTPCAPMPFKPDGPPVEYKTPPDAPKVPPELLTPQPVLPRECADQLALPATPTPTPPGWKPQPAPFESTPGPAVTPDPKGPIFVSGFLESWWNPRDTASRGPITASVTIAIGTVKDRLPAKWATADGKKPPNVFPGSRDFDPATHPEQVVFTPVVLEVEEYLKNPQSASTLTLFVVGGEVSQDVFSVHSPEQSLLQPGNRVVVFLDHEVPPAQQVAGLCRPSATSRLLPDGTVDTGREIRFPLQELREAVAKAGAGGGRTCGWAWASLAGSVAWTGCTTAR